MVSLDKQREHQYYLELRIQVQNLLHLKNLLYQNLLLMCQDICLKLLYLILKVTNFQIFSPLFYNFIINISNLSYKF